MATLMIRKLEDSLKKRLRLRAAKNGHSMEEEARTILRSALAAESNAEDVDLGTAIPQLFAPLGGVDLQLPPREPAQSPPRFDE